jgi:hypothetical protein
MNTIIILMIQRTTTGITYSRNNLSFKHIILLINQFYIYLRAYATAQGPIIKRAQAKMEQTHTQTQKHTKAAWTILKIQSIVQAIMLPEKNKYTYIHTVYN